MTTLYNNRQIAFDDYPNDLELIEKLQVKFVSLFGGPARLAAANFG